MPLRHTGCAALAVLLSLAVFSAAAQDGHPVPRSRSAKALNSGWAADRSRYDESRAGARTEGAFFVRSRFLYRADGKRLPDVLRDFAASLSLPLIVADGVEGTVKGDFDMQGQQFLDTLCKAYGLTWYHDGIALYVYPSSAVQSKLFRLQGFREATVKSLLDSLQLGDKRFPLRFDAQAQTLLVYGPPRHVELVSEVLEQLEAGSADRNRRVVRVVPLRFASAADRTFGQTKVPGLVSTLNSLYSGGNEAGANAGQDDASGFRRPDRVKAQHNVSGTESSKNVADLFGIRGADRNKGESTPAPQRTFMPPGAPSLPRQDDVQVPVFRAEEGTNSILIYAQPQLLANCIELINRLDVKPILIEIEATIIDVSSDSVDQLGVSWSVGTGSSSLSVSSPPVGGNAIPFSMGTLLSNAGHELLARVSALQANGKASVLGKPKVLGLANRTAVMVNKRTVTVKVAGNLEANLFQIDAGTRLQVTPQVNAQDEDGQIRLSLYIEDGAFEDTLVEGVPVMKRIEISTEALVQGGQSILIGGITSSSDVKQLSAVPGLGSLPWVGGLFRTRRDSLQRSERMFLITPRMLRDPVPISGQGLDNLVGQSPPAAAEAPSPAFAPAVNELGPVGTREAHQPSGRRKRRAAKAS